MATANPTEVAEQTDLKESFVKTLSERAVDRPGKPTKVLKEIGDARAKNG